MTDRSDDELRGALDRARAVVAEQPEFQAVVAVASALRRELSNDDADPLRALVAALEYELKPVDRPHDGYGPFGPMIESERGVYPPPVDQIDAVVPGTYELWDRSLRLSPNAMLQARFADLLWEARFGDRPHEYAARAIDAYVSASRDTFGDLLEKSDGIHRALELSAELNDRARLDAAVVAAITLIEGELAQEKRAPGVSLRLIEALTNVGRDARPTELANLLDAAEAQYGGDPWHAESIVAIRARSTGPASRDALWEQAVDGFARRAESSDGLVKYAHFQHAIELAEQHGLRQRAEDLRRQVEQIPHDALGLETVSSEVQIPRAQLDSFIDSIVGDDDLTSALTRFGSHLPTGLPDENREFVRELMADHPLQFLFSRMTIGPENSLVRRTGDEADREEAELLSHEAMRCSMFAAIAVDVLDKIIAKYGPLTNARDWLVSELIERVVAERVGRALQFYEEGDADSASSVLAPRLERIIRELARLAGLNITKSPDARGNPGGVKALGDLLSRLQGTIPEGTRRHLRVLLSEVAGLNLRNRIGHGLVDEVAQHEAALLIHACCHLRLLRSDPDAAGT